MLDEKYQKKVVLDASMNTFRNYQTGATSTRNGNSKTITNEQISTYPNTP